MKMLSKASLRDVYSYNRRTWPAVALAQCPAQEQCASIDNDTKVRNLKESSQSWRTWAAVAGPPPC